MMGNHMQIRILCIGKKTIELVHADYKLQKYDEHVKVN